MQYDMLHQNQESRIQCESEQEKVELELVPETAERTKPVLDSSAEVST